MKYHKDGTLPEVGKIVFVFGSNLAGRHGAGAAKVALTTYGARYGVGAGPQGMSYGIPTKDADIDTMPIERIKPYIDRFIKFTYEHPKLEFFVTRIGCGLAGYKDQDIAPLFKGCNDNCNFPEQWKQYLER